MRLPVTVSNGLNARHTCKFGKKRKYYLGSLEISKETANNFNVGLVEDFSRNSVNISDCGAFSLFKTVTRNRITTNVILWYGTSLPNSSTANP